MSWDPREYCETNDELAREVLDPHEYGEYRQAADERARISALVKRHRNERMRAVDPWADDYKGPTTATDKDF